MRVAHFLIATASDRLLLTRWDDDINHFIASKPPLNTTSWLELARNSTAWLQQQDEFVRYTTTKRDNKGKGGKADDEAKQVQEATDT